MFLSTDGQLRLYWPSLRGSAETFGTPLSAQSACWLCRMSLLHDRCFQAR